MLCGVEAEKGDRGFETARIQKLVAEKVQVCLAVDIPVPGIGVVLPIAANGVVRALTRQRRLHPLDERRFSSITADRLERWVPIVTVSVGGGSAATSGAFHSR